MVHGAQARDAEHGLGLLGDLEVLVDAALEHLDLGLADLELHLGELQLTLVI